MGESLASARRRRERERRYEAEDALERRTYRTRNEYGEPRHMVDWSREAIDKWERETECKRQVLIQQGVVSSVPTSTHAGNIQQKRKAMNLRVTMLLLPAFVLLIVVIIAMSASCN
jgi:hypothetical protein